MIDNKFRIAIHQHFFMCNDLRNLDREDEVLRSSDGPVFDRVGRWASVKGRVHFNRGKLGGVVGKEIA